jgi:hypothetical protein
MFAAIIDQEKRVEPELARDFAVRETRRGWRIARG